MSHIHLPDGALPGGVVLTGLLLTCVMLIFATRQIRKFNLVEYMPRMAFVAALMLIVMSIPLSVIPIHANLSVLAGLMLGPYFSIIAAFIVNVFLAFVGHGTTAMVGINTLVLAGEMIAGYLLVRALGRVLNRQWAGALAVVLTLALSGTAVFMGLNSLGVEVDALIDHDHDEAAATHEHEHEHDQEHEYDRAWWAFPALVAAFLGPSLIFETLLTFFVVGIILKVRPRLMEINTQGRA